MKIKMKYLKYLKMIINNKVTSSNNTLYKVLIIALLSSTNCTNHLDKTKSEKEVETLKNLNDKVLIENVFAKRNEEKENILFLDFWNNMKAEEYEIVCDSLINSGKLRKLDYETIYEFPNSIKYNIDNETYEIKEHNILFAINPIFKESGLVQICFKYKGIDGMINSEQLSTLEHFKKSIFNVLENKYGKCDIQKDGKGYSKTYTWKTSKKIIVIDEGFVRRGKRHMDGFLRQLGDEINENSMILDSFWFSYYERKYFEQKEIEFTKSLNEKNKEIIEKIKLREYEL